MKNKIKSIARQVKRGRLEFKEHAFLTDDNNNKVIQAYRRSQRGKWLLVN